MAYLEVTNLRVEYERDVPTLDQFDLAIGQGELVSLLGPSGCGKTTTLRAVAGFIEPVDGRIVIAERDCTRLPPNRRDIGMVFQSYALFPHLNIFDNVAFGLKMRRVARSDIQQRVHDTLRMVGLEGFEKRRPAQLSGGQRQRVALARAIVIEPALLLFDEPLSNLDAKLRVSMRTEIRRLQQRLDITALYVTHDQVEALAISDRVVVMNEGAIEQDGTPEAIFNQPATAFVANFMGFQNQFQAQVVEANPEVSTVQANGHTVQTGGYDSARPQVVHAYFRPDAAELVEQSAANSLPGTIVMRTFQGNVVEYHVESALGEFVIHQPSDGPQFTQGSVHIKLNARKVIVIPRD